MNVMLSVDDVRLTRWCLQVATSVLATENAADNVELDTYDVIAMIDVLDEKIYNQVVEEEDDSEQLQLFDKPDTVI